MVDECIWHRQCCCCQSEAHTSGDHAVGAAVGSLVAYFARWRQWWRDSFPVTALWRTMCGRFVPPPDMTLLPGALLVRFTGDACEAMRRLLMFLTPLTGSAAITLRAV